MYYTCISKQTTAQREERHNRDGKTSLSPFFTGRSPRRPLGQRRPHACKAEARRGAPPPFQFSESWQCACGNAPATIRCACGRAPATPPEIRRAGSGPRMQKRISHSGHPGPPLRRCFEAYEVLLCDGEIDRGLWNVDASTFVKDYHLG